MHPGRRAADAESSPAARHELRRVVDIRARVDGECDSVNSCCQLSESESGGTGSIPCRAAVSIIRPQRVLRSRKTTMVL